MSYLNDASDEDHEYTKPSSFLIEKSSSNIHQTINPMVKYTAMQAKILHAVQFKLQQMRLEKGLSPQQFHSNHKGNLTIHMKSSDFKRLIDCESRNTPYIRKLMNELSSLSATWDTMTQDPKNGKIGFLNLFIGAEYTNQSFKFILPEHTVKLLISDEKSAVIDVLTVAQSLDSKYAVFLNDLLEEQSFRQSSDDFTITVTDDQLRNLLKIPYKIVDKKKVYTYPQPAALIRTAIKPAVTQINNANLRFEIADYSHRKESAEIYWVFNVLSRKAKQLQNFAVQNAVELDNIRKALREFGVTHAAINKIVNQIASEKELDYVQFNIEIVQQQKKSNLIKKSPASLFMSIMEKNREAHDEKWDELKREKDIQKAIRNAQYNNELKRQRDEAIKEYCELKLQNFISDLFKNETLRHKTADEFLAHLANVPTKSAETLQDSVRDSGLTESIINAPAFKKFAVAFIRQGITEDEIDDYLGKVGTTIHL